MVKAKTVLTEAYFKPTQFTVPSHVLRSIQDQAGQGSKQPDRAVDVAVYCRGVGLHGL